MQSKMLLTKGYTCTRLDERNRTWVNLYSGMVMTSTSNDKDCESKFKEMLSSYVGTVAMLTLCDIV